jgi:hypothetical protein
MIIEGPAVSVYWYPYVSLFTSSLIYSKCKVFFFTEANQHIAERVDLSKLGCWTFP